jgi:diguanylate cyclase (GGDEF)-like protein
MAAMTGLLLVAYGTWQVFRHPFGNPELVSDLSFVPISIAAIAGAWAAARRCHDRPRLRSAWRLIALASASYLAADIVWMVYALAGTRPYPSAADAMFILFYPLMLCGLLRFPAPRRSSGEWARLALDLAVVAIGGAVIVFYVVLGPTVVKSGSDVLQTAFSVAYPVGDMILLVGLGSVLLRAGASNPAVLRLIAAGLVCFVAADLAFGYISLHATYQSGNPVDMLWMAAMALFAVAGAAQPSAQTDAEPQAEHRLRSASWAPYIAVAAAFGVLILSERDAALVPGLSLVLAAVVLATLVSARQFLAQRDLVQTQGRLSYQSLHDALTGLPNRVLVLDRAQRMLAHARRNDTTVAALYVDVDGFKHVNDNFGHAAGDELLRVVAHRLSEGIRESDTVGRLSGDEFVVFLDNATLDAGPELVADRLCESLAQPIELSEAGRVVAVTASIGIALGRDVTTDDLLGHADSALYAAKAAGKNRWSVFVSTMHSAAQDRLALATDLTQALPSANRVGYNLT